MVDHYLYELRVIKPITLSPWLVGYYKMTDYKSSEVMWKLTMVIPLDIKLMTLNCNYDKQEKKKHQMLVFIYRIDRRMIFNFFVLE